jgi:predicted nucleotidyltransferase
MELAPILETLRAHRPLLEAAGIAHAGVFGSVARGEARPDSDIDILIEFAPGRVPDLWTYAGLREQVAALIPAERVDVVGEGVLRPAMRARVARDLILAF